MFFVMIPANRTLRHLCLEGMGFLIFYFLFLTFFCSRFIASFGGNCEFIILCWTLLAALSRKLRSSLVSFLLIVLVSFDKK